MTDENVNNLAKGYTLGHYRIARKIGAGGMGEVYLANDTKLDRKVALKILPPEFAEDADRMSRFVREAKSASALNHPNIITIHEIGEADGTHFIATEFIDGNTLSDYMKSNLSNYKFALEIAIQIASALEEAHTARIIHRDIKPDNVMIRSNGLVKILDFGIAKLSAPTSTDAEAATAIKGTSPGLIIGTANYMSPEQAKGKEIDARTDIFSFGIVLYEMIAGHLPFEGETALEMIGAILKDAPKPLDADVPAEISKIIGKCLRKNRDERYQTIKDVGNDLKDVRQDLEFQDKLERTVSPDRAEPKTQILPATTADESHQTTTNQTVSHSPKMKYSAVGLLVLLLAIGGFFGYKYFAPTNKQIESIAVMPFVNESGNQNVEYLSDGMTETLINSLSQLPKLSVKARSSVFRYKGRETDSRQIGTDLNVQAVLNGRVVQHNDDLILYLSLVDAATENQIWGKQYNRKLSNVVSLQNEIAQDVSNNLQIRLAGAEQLKITKNYTESAEAYQLYLRGRFYWFKFPAKEFEKSRDYYQKAIDIDANYALAYAGLAEYYGFGAANGSLPPSDENWAKSETAAKKALDLDNTLPDAYNALAGVKQFNYDRAGAETELKRAIELNTNYAEARAHYAAFLIEDGRSEEAFAQMKKVLELEPLSVRYNRLLANIFYRKQDYDRAVEQYQKILELDPNDAFTHELLGDVYERKGLEKEAIAEWSRALTLTGKNETAASVERDFAAAGFNAAVRLLWQKKLEGLNEKTRRGEYVPAMNYAIAYIRLADKEQAFAWLNRAAQERNRLIFDVKTDPIYDSLRDDARFKDLLKRMNLPE